MKLVKAKVVPIFIIYSIFFLKDISLFYISLNDIYVNSILNARTQANYERLY